MMGNAEEDDRIAVIEKNKKHIVTTRWRTADRLMKRLIDRLVAGTGVYRGQHQLLMKLYFSPECTQTELAERMDISPSAVAVTLKKLEKGGFVERESQKKDNRSNQILLTERGQRVVDQSIEIFHELDNQLFAGFSEEELDCLDGMFRRMFENLSEYYQKVCQGGTERDVL